MSDADRRGILTSKDKEWLRDEIEYEHRQTEADRRREIRERVAAALQDFELLNEYWSEKEELEMIKEFDDPEEPAAEIIEFLYRVLNLPATEPEEMVYEGAVERALAFRKALSQGIHDGKQHYGEPPNFVLVNSNTELFEIPSEDELQKVIDTDHWRNANERHRGAANTPDDEIVEKEDAATQTHLSIKTGIGEYLHSRRDRADTEVKRYEKMIAQTMPLPERDVSPDSEE